jgi:hypothetical protein
MPLRAAFALAPRGRRAVPVAPSASRHDAGGCFAANPGKRFGRTLGGRKEVAGPELGRPVIVAKISSWTLIPLGLGGPDVDWLHVVPPHPRGPERAIGERGRARTENRGPRDGPDPHGPGGFTRCVFDMASYWRRNGTKLASYWRRIGAVKWITGAPPGYWIPTLPSANFPAASGSSGRPKPDSRRVNARPEFTVISVHNLRQLGRRRPKPR